MGEDGYFRLTTGSEPTQSGLTRSKRLMLRARLLNELTAEVFLGRERIVRPAAQHEI